MPKTAIDVAAVLLLVLPGFLAYRFALARRADPTRRSPLWQLAAMLEYSVYVHIVGIALVFGALWLLADIFGVSSHISELPRKGPQEFLVSYFAEGVLLFTLYPVYVVFGAILMGAYDVPNWVAAGFVRSISALTGKVGSIPGMKWVPSPRPGYPDEPIWYHALSVEKGDFSGAPPLLLVRMKRGDVYYGELASYPVLPDSQKEKDFLIKSARYYPKGDRDQEYRLHEHPGGGSVLLNTADVDSIEVYYQPVS
ncbi:MAG: hypothetical protein F4W93_14105 [Dehalococcoidia bacterium]|nr:hypothetical protein [Dehalococcoidia bacterium]